MGSDREGGRDERRAGGLGWFSIGLGLARVLAPRGFARFLGVEDDPKNCTLLRLVGLRELACGVGLLTGRRPAGWAWARVAGDVMDVALLGSALASGPPGPGRVTAATAAALGATAADLSAAAQLGGGTATMAHTLGLGEIHVKKAERRGVLAGVILRRAE
jgi:hypothetical protein